MKLSLRLPLILSLAAAALAAHAQFIGTQVAGNFRSGGTGLNYFDPANGQVPAGYLNSTQGTSVTVAEPAIEFGLMTPSNTDTVNVTTNSIVLTDASQVGGTAYQIDLTDTAFGGRTFTKTADSFQNGGVTLTQVGNTLSFVIPQFNGLTTMSATFVVNPVPEPASFAALGLGALAVLRRRR